MWLSNQDESDPALIPLSDVTYLPFMAEALIQSRTVAFSMEEVRKKLTASVAGRGLVPAAVHDLQPLLVQHGSFVKGEYAAFDVGHVGPIKEILEVYPDIISLLPGRICASGRDGHTVLTFIRPSVLARHARLPAKHRKLIETACRDFEQRLSRLLNELG